MHTSSIDHPTATLRSKRLSIRHDGICSLAVAALLLAFGSAAEQRAQSEALNFFEHIPVEFPHYTPVNTNIALHYVDRLGNTQDPTYGEYGFSVFHFFPQTKLTISSIIIQE